MNRIMITMIAILVVIGAMFTAVIIFEPKKEDNFQKVETQVSQEEILDDCTDEYEGSSYENTIKANTQEEKTSPNCSLTIKTYYKKCAHTKSEYANLPQSFVNLTKNEIQQKYQEYDVESFASNAIVLCQEKEEECGEHYMVKDKDGMVTIYQILEDGTQREIETTGISTEYLTQTDKKHMENGIQVNGKQNLNQLLEDFE